LRPIFRKGVTGDLQFRPPEGPPTSGTVTLKKHDGTIFRSDVVATVPVVGTTLTAPVSAGSTQIAVAAVTNCEPGVDLWIGDDEDGRDHLSIMDVDPVTELVYFRRPLMHPHVFGEEVISGELSVTLEAAEVVEEMEGNTAWWTYVVDGITYDSEQVWDVVLRDFRLIIPEDRLKRYVAVQLFEASTQSPTELLDQAHWIITQKLRRRGIKPEWIVDPTEFERAAGLLVRVLLLDEEMQISAHRIRVLEEAQRAFVEEWELLIRNRPRWLDRDHDTLVGEDEAAPLIEQEVSFPDFSVPR
jgi:hypothetical protein